MAKHKPKTILSLVQFKGVNLEKRELPRVYLATRYEVGERLKDSRGGLGDTVLKENHTRRTGPAEGITDKIPDEWKFNKQRIALFNGKM